MAQNRNVFWNVFFGGGVTTRRLFMAFTIGNQEWRKRTANRGGRPSRDDLARRRRAVEAERRRQLKIWPKQRHLSCCRKCLVSIAGWVCAVRSVKNVMKHQPNYTKSTVIAPAALAGNPPWGRSFADSTAARANQVESTVVINTGILRGWP